MYDIENEEYFVSRDVVFYENIFHYTSSSKIPVTCSPTPLHPAIYDHDPLPLSLSSLPVGVRSPTNDLVREIYTELGNLAVRGSSKDVLSVRNTGNTDTAHAFDISSSLEIGDSKGTVALPPESSLQHNDRTRQPSTRLRDYVCHTVHCLDPPSLLSASSSSSGTPYPIINYISCKRFSCAHACSYCRV